MTSYLIEIRASSQRHDIYARKLAREILHLSAMHLPSLMKIIADKEKEPFILHTALLYYISGDLDPIQLDQLIQQLLVDSVVQEARVSREGEPTTFAAPGHTVDVYYHAGVTDTLAESVLAGAHIVGITGLERVETGHRFVLDARLSTDDVRAITQAILYNPVIQNYRLHVAVSQEGMGVPGVQELPLATEVREGEAINDRATSRVAHTAFIPLSQMTDEQLLDISRKGLLALNIEEMRAIQQQYRAIGREPTDVELETLAQTWSEHCSHKTFKATIHYRELDSNGHELETEQIDGLLKRYIMHATEQIKPSWLVSAFSDNAGMIRFTTSHDLAFKVETHNHPSAIEPFGGANTGVGGVIRDVLGVSAQPIACTDVLCFGPPDTPMDELARGILSPQRIADGVVNGIRDYGNKMGIPTVNGAMLYHPGYIYNPLVYCGCLGILPHGSHPAAVQPGDKIVALGGRTGRDGVHGATFSSGEMSSEINAQAGSAVQIGAPITEKKVADVIMQARDRQLYHAITDCGAGGFSSAVGEMGAKTGARVELANAPLKYQGLAPWEIWLSEAQERMVLAVPPSCLDELLAICAIEDVEASIIGSFTDDQRLTVSYQGEVVADLEMAFLHDGRPGRTLEAVWTRQPIQSLQRRPSSQTNAIALPDLTQSLEPSLLALLRHPSIASKENVVRRYDFEVQGATVLKPLVGRAGNGPGDAAVLQPILPEPSQAGIVISNGINPLYGQIDPYHMAVNAIDEALRNLTAVGGDVTHAAILDNFCWGNPADPEQLGLLVRAVKGCHDAAIGFRVPFISGKDSLNNEYRSEGRRLPVIPTLLISAVGVIDDTAQTVDMALKTPGDLLYLIGRTRNELAGSHYAEVVDKGSFAQIFPQTAMPQVDIEHALITMKALGEAIRKGMVRACHDLSEGGVAVAVAEMALANMQGVTIDASRIVLAQGVPVQRLPGLKNIVRLFSESPSRFLVEIAPEQLGAFEQYMRSHGINDIAYIGTVSASERLIVQDGDNELLNLSVTELQEAWKGVQA
ncbi:MAG TPA: phosphoribosylformylglycinamidine synthase subunit PurL [Ktedonobacteraceae bacterium]|nr:phosphoribosylformylglycinamidine synthase subunit PurL [Ktedonobacteraceae bacterium]